MEVLQMETPTKSKKSKHLDSLFFPVEAVDIRETDLFNGLSFGARYSQAIYLPFFEKIVNVAGANYQLTSNEEFYAPIYDELVKTFGSSQIKVQATNEDDSRFCTDFIITNKELAVVDKDVINLMLRARNSYDGTVRASVEFLAYRKVCENGLHAWTTYEAPGLKKGVLKHNREITPLLNGLGRALESLTLKVDQFKTFTDRIVTGHEMDQVIERLSEIKGTVSYPKKVLQDVPQKIAQEMSLLGSKELSAWQLYNGFNFFLNHDTRINLRENIKSQIDHQVKDTIAGLLQISSLN